MSRDITAHRLITYTAIWKRPTPVLDHKPLLKGRPTQLEQTLTAQPALPWQSCLHATGFGTHLCTTIVVSVPETTATVTLLNKTKIIQEPDMEVREPHL